MIVIPAVDVRGGKAVRLLRGHPGEMTVYGDDPVEVAAGFAEAGAEWIHVVDLDAALGAGENADVLRRVVEASTTRVQVGGGLRTVRSVEAVLAVGAARAVVGTEAVASPGFLRECLSRWGERIVVALDNEAGRVRVKGWTEEAGPFAEVLERLEAVGAPRYLITAVSRDGTLGGPDLALYRRAVAGTERPVLASGGVGTLEHVRELAAVGVEGVVVGKALYEGAFTLRDAMEAAA